MAGSREDVGRPTPPSPPEASPDTTVAVAGAAASGTAGLRPPWRELERLRPLTLRSCRRLVVVAPHPRDEIRAAGGLLRRVAARHATVDVLWLTEAPTRTCIPARGLDVSTVDADPGDGPDDGPDDGADPGEGAIDAAYRELGITAVRRHRLRLPDGGVAGEEADVVGAISEIVGFAAEEPAGLCVLAPWSGDGDDDHEAAGRAAEVATAAYRVRLVRWLDQAWTWAGPESTEVPWRRARQVALSETVLARKMAAHAAFGDRPGRDTVLPVGSAPGPREVFLV